MSKTLDAIKQCWVAGHSSEKTRDEVLKHTGTLLSEAAIEDHFAEFTKNAQPTGMHTS